MAPSQETCTCPPVGDCNEGYGLGPVVGRMRGAEGGFERDGGGTKTGGSGCELIQRPAAAVCKTGDPQMSISATPSLTHIGLNNWGLRCAIGRAN